MSMNGMQRGLPALTALTLALVMVQVLVPLFPELYWDWSPLAQAQAPAALALGPTGSAWLTVLSVLVLILTTGIEPEDRLRKSGVQWLLGMAGIGFAGWHMARGDAMDAFVCNAWIGAAALGLSASRLMRDDAARRVLWVGLAALIVPLGVGAIGSVYVDHPATVRFFLQSEAETIAQRGWEWDSPQHLIYRRRLMQAEATGAFGLANTFGSVMAALALLAAGAAWRHLRVQPRRLALTGPLLLLAGTALWLSGARGAILAALLAGLWLIFMVWRPGGRRLATITAGILILLPIAVVLIRMLLGPPQAVEGERSLLFRGFYWWGAANMVTQESLGQALLGTGPSWFKDLQAAYKHPLNPEDVASAHNVFVDWLTMLGLGGLAWSALLLAWLFSGLRGQAPWVDQDIAQSRRGHADKAQASLSRVDARWLGYAALGSLPAFLVQYLVQSSAMTLERSLVWILCVGLFVLVATLLAQDAWFPEIGARRGLLAAAVALLIHNQIEMTFFHPGSVAMAMVLLGMAGGAGFAEPPAAAHPPSSSFFPVAGPGRRWSRRITLTALALLGIGMTHHAWQTTQWQAQLGRAAEGARRGDLAAAQQGLEQALQRRPDPVHARALADILLARAHDQASLLEALARADAMLEGMASILGPRLTLLHLRAQLADRAAQMTGQPQAVERALDLGRELARRQPCSPHAAWFLARAMARAGADPHALRTAYERALTLSDQMYLDPLAPLAPGLRKEIQAMLEELP